MTALFLSPLFVFSLLVVALLVSALVNRDSRSALLALPVVVVNLIVNVTALAGVPLQFAAKLIGAVDAFTVARWAETAHWLSHDSNSREDREAAAELRAKVKRAHGLGPKEKAPTPLVVPAREIPAGLEGVIR